MVTYVQSVLTNTQSTFNFIGTILVPRLVRQISPDNNCQFLSPPGIKVLSFLRLAFSYIGLVKSETLEDPHNE